MHKVAVAKQTILYHRVSFSFTRSVPIKMKLGPGNTTGGPIKKMNLMGSTYHSLNNSVLHDNNPYKASNGDQTPTPGACGQENILGELFLKELSRLASESKDSES